MREYVAITNIGTHPLTKKGDVITDEGVLKKIDLFVKMGQAEAIPAKKEKGSNDG